MHYVNLIMAICLGVGLVTAGCKPKNRYVQVGTPETGQILDESFEASYDAIFDRKRPDDQRATAWNKKYLGSWVRWTGTVKSFTGHGVTILQMPSTKTFDVSLTLSAAELERARRTLKKGSRIAYMGKFDQFDEIWRTIYLVQGTILEVPSVDAGSPTSPPAATVPAR